MIPITLLVLFGISERPENGDCLTEKRGELTRLSVSHGSGLPKRRVRVPISRFWGRYAMSVLEICSCGARTTKCSRRSVSARGPF